MEKAYVSDSMPTSSLRDRHASAYTGSSSPPSNYNYNSAGSSKPSQPETMSDSRPAYVPGQTGYAPGSTGYKPPSAPTYTSPGGSYTAPGSTSGSSGGYSPGSVDRYRSDSSSGSSPMGSYPSYPSSSGSQSDSPYGYKLPTSG